jgi:hypothetical protein
MQMNVNTIAHSTYQNAIDCVYENMSDSNKDSFSEKNDNEKCDKIDISKAGYDLQSKSAEVVVKSGKDYLGASWGKNNVLIIHFTDSAMVSRTIQRGYITINGVQIDLSDDVKSSLQKTDERAKADREQAFQTYYVQQNMAVAKQQGEVYQKQAQDEAKALETARRIAKGGKVPSVDEQKLMEYSPELYAMAKMQAMMAKRHEKYDSLYEDEKNSESDSETNNSTFKSYETTMSVSMEGSPQIQEISEAEVDV